MDTDHLSLFERNHPKVVNRVLAKRQNEPQELSTTIVSLQEQLEGRLAQIRKARDPERLTMAYKFLKKTLGLFADVTILDYDAAADRYFQTFRKEGIRIGTQDLRIASIVLSNKGVLLTRNLRDFEKVPGLAVEDWAQED